MKRSVSFFLVWILLIEFSGCYSTKILPAKSLPVPEKKYYYVHSGKSTIVLINVAVSGGVLKGNIDFPGAYPYDSQVVHLYIAPDTTFKIDNKTARVPVENIVKVETTSYDRKKTNTTFMSMTGAIGGLLLLVLIIAFSQFD